MPKRQELRIIDSRRTVSSSTGASSPIGTHTHDSRYYLRGEVDALLAGYVLKASFGADTLLKADAAGTPIALNVPTSTLVGRGASGGIAALNAGAARTVLGLATTDSPQFAGVVTNVLRPPSDTTDAVRVTNAALNRNVLTIDTTNERVGINASTPPVFRLDVHENVNAVVTIARFRNFSSGNSAAAQFQLQNDAGPSLALGILSSTHTAYPGYGESNDTFFYSSFAAGNFNFFAANPNKAIRFYGGRNATQTPSFIVRTESVGVNVTIPTFSSGRGIDIGGANLRLRESRTPASSTAAGAVGEICWDANYIYVCVATNTWRRVAHAGW